MCVKYIILICLIKFLIAIEYTLLEENIMVTSSVLKHKSINYSIEVPREKEDECIYITLYIYSGRAALSSFLDEDQSYPVGNLSSKGNLHRMKIPVSLLEAKDDSFVSFIKIESLDDTYFIIYFQVINNTINKVYWIPEGYLMLFTINKEEDFKSFKIKKRTSGKDNFFFTFSTLNCLVYLTYEGGTYYIKKSKQISYNGDGEPKIKITLNSLDSMSENKEEDCLLYISSHYANKDSISNPLMIDEGVIHTFELNSEIKKISFRHPYFITGSDDIIFIYINKLSGYGIKISYYAYEIEQSGKFHKYHLRNVNSKLFVISNEELTSICEKGTICWVSITVEDLDNKFDGEFDRTAFEIEVITKHPVPTYLKLGQMKVDSVVVNHYRYYYTDVTNLQQGEVIIHFKRGVGNAFAKIIPKGFSNNNIKLPKKEDSDTFKYDYFNKKINFNVVSPINCVNGCELLIGIYSEDLKKTVTYPMTEYTIFIRFPETEVVIYPNEYVFGSLGKTKEDGVYDYFSIDLEDDTDRVILNFDSELCIGTIYAGKINQYFIITRTFILTAQALNSKTLKGIRLHFDFTAQGLDGEYNSYYSFKVTVPEKGAETIIPITSSQNEICNIEPEKDRCYFIISKNFYDPTYTMHFYAFSDNPNDDIEFFVSVYDAEDYNNFGFEEKVKALPSEAKYNFTSHGKYDSNYLEVNLLGLTSEAYVIIAIKSVKGKEITFLSSYHYPYMMSSLRPNTNEIFYINSQSTINYLIKGNDVYYVEVNRIRGSGTAKIAEDTSENNNEDAFLISEKEPTVSYIVMPNSRKMNLMINGISETPFVYYVKYKVRTSKENIDLVKLGKRTLISYNKKIYQKKANHRNNSVFPISFYFYLGEDYEKADVQINFRVINKVDFDWHPFINIDAVVTNENFIYRRKRNIEALPELKANAKKKYFDETYNVGNIVFDKEDIKSFNVIDENKNVVFLSIKSEDTKLFNAEDNIEVEIFPFSNDESFPIILPEEQYFFHQDFPKGKKVFKMERELQEDNVYIIELSGKNIEYDIQYETFQVSVEKKIIKNETLEYGKKKIVLHLPSLRFKMLIFTVSSKVDKENSFAVRYRTMTKEKYDIQKSIRINSKLTFERIDKKSIKISFNHPVLDENEILSNSNYTLRIYPRYLFKNKDDTEKIYISEKSKNIFSSNLASYSKEGAFMLHDFNEGEVFINLVASAGQYKELFCYQTLHIKGAGVEKDKSFFNYAVLASLFIIAIFILFIIFLMIRKIRLLKFKARIEEIEYQKIETK